MGFDERYFNSSIWSEYLPSPDWSLYFEIAYFALKNKTASWKIVLLICFSRSDNCQLHIVFSEFFTGHFSRQRAEKVIQSTKYIILLAWSILGKLITRLHIKNSSMKFIFIKIIFIVKLNIVENKMQILIKIKMFFFIRIEKLRILDLDWKQLFLSITLVWNSFAITLKVSNTKHKCLISTRCLSNFQSSPDF